jgi:cobalamin biosynthesis Co2+ chelatase CbiK
MNSIFEDLVVDQELTPELQQIKQELDQNLEAELDKIENNSSLTWVAKQRYSTDLQRDYESTWEKHLTDAGYVVRPVFESLEKDTIEDWYEELNKLNG